MISLLNWARLDCAGLGWVRLGCNGLSWAGQDWNGLGFAVAGAGKKERGRETLTSEKETRA